MGTLLSQNVCTEVSAMHCSRLYLRSDPRRRDSHLWLSATLSNSRLYLRSDPRRRDSHLCLSATLSNSRLYLRSDPRRRDSHLCLSATLSTCVTGLCCCRLVLSPTGQAWHCAANCYPGHHVARSKLVLLIVCNITRVVVWFAHYARREFSSEEKRIWFETSIECKWTASGTGLVISTRREVTFCLQAPSLTYLLTYLHMGMEIKNAIHTVTELHKK